MKTITQVISAVGLILTVGPSFLVFSGHISWSTHATLMIIGAVLWFATAPYWMKSKDSPA